MECSSRITSFQMIVDKVVQDFIETSGTSFLSTGSRMHRFLEEEQRQQSPDTIALGRSLMGSDTRCCSSRRARIMRFRVSDGLPRKSNTTIASAVSSGLVRGRSGRKEILRLSMEWTNIPYESKLLGSWGVSEVSTLRAIGRIPSSSMIHAMKKIHRRQNRGVKPTRYSSQAWWKR